jgi:hypothetical protein
MLSLGYFGKTETLELTLVDLGGTYTAPVGQDLCVLSDADVFMARANEATDADFPLKADTYCRVSLLKGETLSFLGAAAGFITLTPVN